MKLITVVTIIVVAIALLAVAGCVQVGPKELKPQECPKLAVPKCPELKTQLPTVNKPVATFDLPGIPAQVVMKISGDTIVECNSGCETLIKNYANAQRVLRGQEPWP